MQSAGCITAHPHFHTLRLDKLVLDVAYLMLRTSFILRCAAELKHTGSIPSPTQPVSVLHLIHLLQLIYLCSYVVLSYA